VGKSVFGEHRHGTHCMYGRNFFLYARNSSERTKKLSAVSCGGGGGVCVCVGVCVSIVSRVARRGRDVEKKKSARGRNIWTVVKKTRFLERHFQYNIVASACICVLLYHNNRAHSRPSLLYNGYTESTPRK